MKKILSVILIAILLIVATSCAKSTSETQSKSVSRSQNNIEMVSYTNVIGTVNIPKNPKAIVSDYYVGELLKLKVNLVGADLTYKSSAWVDKLNGVKDIGQSLEVVSSLKPDLIITMKQDMVEQYKNVAPTVCIPYGTYNPEELIVELSKITNTQDMANEWVKNFNENIYGLKALVTDTTKTYTIIDVLGKDIYLYGENFGRGGYILYNKLGLKGTPDAEKDYIRKKESYLLLNIESAPKYINDTLFIMNADGTKKITENFSNNVVWNNLNAIKNGNVAYFKSMDFMYTDPFSLDMQINILKDYFNGKK